MAFKIAVLPGDGIGSEVMESCLNVLKAVKFQAKFKECSIGLSAIKKHGTNLPKKTVHACKKSSATLLGATQTPSTGKLRSATVKIRRQLKLHANIRPCFSLTKNKKFDFVIFRENTEGLYTGIERKTTKGANAVRKITRIASKKIALTAFEWAEKEGRKKVAIVHKANILRQSCGVFRKQALNIAKKFSGIKTSEMLVDACAYNIVKNPGQFDVIVTTNLFGDILSDAGSGVMGSLGAGASANIGSKNALFEPVHGSAPDIAGKGTANPTGMILSGAMMLKYLGENKTSEKIKKIVLSEIQKGNATKDLGGRLSTKQFTEKIVSRLTLSK